MSSNKSEAVNESVEVLIEGSSHFFKKSDDVFFKEFPEIKEKLAKIENPTPIDKLNAWLDFNTEEHAKDIEMEQRWVKKFLTRKDITLNEDGSYDVEGNVTLRLFGHRFKRIPLQFNKVEGSFDCYNNQLESLEGAPREVSGYFSCRKNHLLTLEYAPQKVGRSFGCCDNPIQFTKEDVKAISEVVGGIFVQDYLNNT